MPEAETTARQAVAWDPQSADAQIALGNVLRAEAFYALSGEPTVLDFTNYTASYYKLVARLKANPLDTKTSQRIKTLIDTARAAFDLAVKLAPKDAKVYQARLTFLREYVLGIGLVQQDVTGKADVTAFTRDMKTYFEDVRQVALLHQDDFDALVSIARIDMELGTEFGSGSLVRSQDLKEIMDRLATLSSRSDNVDVAVHAQECLGELQYEILLNSPLAEATLRAALSRAPARGRTLLLLAEILSMPRRYDELAALLTEQISKHDTAQAHLLLARTLQKQGLWSQSQPISRQPWQ